MMLNGLQNLIKMSITKTWEVNTLKRELADGYVKNVVYRIKGIEDGKEKVRVTGEVELLKPNQLIPYSDLTHDTVIGWVKTKLGTDEVTAIEKSIEDEIALINKPVTEEGTPW